MGQCSDGDSLRQKEGKEVLGIGSAPKLPDIFLSSGISEEVVRELSRGAKLVSFGAGERIFRVGDSADTLWILKRGKVILKHSAGEGEEVIVDILTPREVIVGISALIGEPYAAEAWAGSECLLLRLPARVVREAMKESAELTQRLFMLLVQRVRHMEKSLVLFRHTAGHRIIQTLYELCQKFGNEVPVTHRELAGIAGTTVETSIRTLSPLRGQGILRLGRGRITILNKRKLRHLALSNRILRVTRR